MKLKLCREYCTNVTAGEYCKRLCMMRSGHALRSHVCIYHQLRRRSE